MPRPEVAGLILVPAKKVIIMDSRIRREENPMWQEPQWVGSVQIRELPPSDLV
jgi:hypothetical protein